MLLDDPDQRRHRRRRCGAPRGVMNAKRSDSGGSSDTHASRSAKPSSSISERDATESPTPRTTRSSAAAGDSTSTTGSSRTPASAARSLQLAPRRVVVAGEHLRKHELRGRELLDRARLAAQAVAVGGDVDRLGRPHPLAYDEPALVDRQRDQPGLKLAAPHRVGRSRSSCGS